MKFSADNMYIEEEYCSGGRMRIGMIILARANYGRWPDKVLFELEGKTLLEHVIRKSKELNVDGVIVSTTMLDEDQIIRDIATANGAELSFGEPEDRTDRMYKAITENGFDYFIHISPAELFFDVEYTNILIEEIQQKSGYTHYFMAGGTSMNCVPEISTTKVVINKYNNSYVGQEHFGDCPDGQTKAYYSHRNHEEETNNRWLFDCNIAYKLQAKNHREICEHLGHFPKNHEEIMKALEEIEL